MWIWTIKCKQMAKMNDWVPKERLGTSSLNDVFVKIYLYDPPQNVRDNKLAVIEHSCKVK